MEYYIGIDLGTTGCKSIVFDEFGTICGQEYIEYALILLSETEIEQDANLWWELTVKAVNTAVAKSGIDGNSVKGISISSQGISIVPVDKSLAPLHNAISWLDIRTTKQTQYIRSVISEDEIFEITGKKAESYVLAKLMWFRENCAEIYKNTYKFLMPQDFIFAKLTGGCCYTDPTMASGTMIYDIKNNRYSEKILKTFDIDEELLPQVKVAGKTTHIIDKDVALLLGISPDTQIAVGGQDQKVAAFGAGIKANIATISLGTAGAIEFFCETAVIDPMHQLPTFTFLDGKYYTLEAVVPTTGASLKWARNSLFPTDEYDYLTSKAADAKIGSNGLMFFPHLTGAGSPHWNSDAKGCFYGISLNTNRHDIIRSILEGIAYQLRQNLDTYERISSSPVKQVSLFGGGCYSPLWCQIISNVLNKPVITYKSPEVANFGAAKLAYLGVNGNCNDFGATFLSDSNTYLPIEEEVSQYQELYKTYCELEQKIF